MAKIKTATRTLSNAGRLRLLVAVASPKAIGEMPAESLVEYDGLIELLADPDIVSAQVQPETIKLYVNGLQRTYTPDVRFVRRDGRIGYREFKHSKHDLDEDLKVKLDAARAALEADGYEFEVRDANDIRRGYRIDNLRLLKRYASWPTSKEFQRRVWEFVGGAADMCLQDVRDFVGGDKYGSLYRMLWEQQLRAELVGAPLCAATAISRGEL
ncbi:hypothetical protein [Hydrogenophaga sp.]|uniref:hypothetical protein n=1 Tax=Hydrogenophaga sp. TaxID=1904254 RepID=UPI002FCAEE9B